MSESHRPVYDFADFRVDAGKRLLLHAGAPVPLAPKVFNTLLLLVQQADTVLEKQTIIDAIWPDTTVEENNLNQNISTLRRVLGDNRGASRFIATVPGIGYRFTADIQVLDAQVLHAARQNGRPIRLAVLPFENLGAGPEREYLADGLTEETIASLGQIDPDHFRVIGRTSVMSYKRTTKTLADIGRELDASYLIESSLRAEGPRLRITSKLIRVPDQLQIWSASFDSEPSSLLAFQRDLSIAIAEQVRLRLSPARLTALTNRHTHNPEAYDLYLRGRFFWNQFTPLTTRRAIEYFTHATQLDPDYALAWSGLTDAFCSSPITGDAPPHIIIPRAREAVDNAVRSDPTLAEVQASLGFFQFWLGWDWVVSEAAQRKAIALDSNYAFAHRMLGIVLSHLGRHEEAIASIRRARELDPLSAMNRALSSQIAFAARDFPTALHFAREAVIIDPEFWIGYHQLAQAYFHLQQNEQALDALSQANRLSAGNSKALSLRGYLLASVNRRAEALEVLQTLDSVSSERFFPPYAIALIHAGLSPHDPDHAALALDWLERASEAHDAHLVFLTVDPKWDPFRAEPRFEAILKRCGFFPHSVAEKVRKPKTNGGHN
jgi:DNA-binding winged helix-turn-helix (wHTH) protein/Tfp pilus assembly protein PilF